MNGPELSLSESGQVPGCPLRQGLDKPLGSWPKVKSKPGEKCPMRGVPGILQACAGDLVAMAGGTQAWRMHLIGDSECGAAGLIEIAYSIFSFMAHKYRACPDWNTMWNTCITMYFPYIIPQVISFMEYCHLAHLCPLSCTPGIFEIPEKKPHHVTILRS